MSGGGNIYSSTVLQYNLLYMYFNVSILCLFRLPLLHKTLMSYLWLNAEHKDSVKTHQTDNKDYIPQEFV